VNGKFDITAIGYPVVRAAFNDTLQLCVEKLTKADIRLAQDILDAAVLEQDEPGFQEMLADTALYSRKAARKSKRAIDRIAPKLAQLSDPLKSAIAMRLPAAIFSIFDVEAGQAPDIVQARDMLDDGRSVSLMDHALATLVARQGRMLIAGRFVDLGAWHIGFGIVKQLRKSEALAINLSLADDDDIVTRRNDLHELLYPTQLHGENLVMSALEPMIATLALAVDADIIDAEDLMAGFGSLRAMPYLNARDVMPRR
jgi:hypothetical protein